MKISTVNQGRPQDQIDKKKTQPKYLERDKFQDFNLKYFRHNFNELSITEMNDHQLHQLHTDY